MRKSPNTARSPDFGRRENNEDPGDARRGFAMRPQDRPQDEPDLKHDAENEKGESDKKQKHAGPNRSNSDILAQLPLLLIACFKMKHGAGKLGEERHEYANANKYIDHREKFAEIGLW